MLEVTVLPLQRHLDEQIFLDHIEWWREGSRFVVVKYASRGEPQQFGMRLDLDKQVFLDRFDNEYLDRGLQSLVPEICKMVAEYRSGLPSSGYATL